MYVYYAPLPRQAAWWMASGAEPNQRMGAVYQGAFLFPSGSPTSRLPSAPYAGWEDDKLRHHAEVTWRTD